MNAGSGLGGLPRTPYLRSSQNFPSRHSGEQRQGYAWLSTGLSSSSNSASNDLRITCTLTSPLTYSTVPRTDSPPGGSWTNSTLRTWSGSQWNVVEITLLSAVLIVLYLLTDWRGGA